MIRVPGLVQVFKPIVTNVSTSQALPCSFRVFFLFFHPVCVNLNQPSRNESECLGFDGIYFLFLSLSSSPPHAPHSFIHLFILFCTVLDPYVLSYASSVTIVP